MNPAPSVIRFREIIHGSEDYHRECELRQAVLRRPLGLDLYDEDLHYEATQLHFGLFEGATLLACIVTVPLATATVKLRQMAVAPDRQGQGVGRRLMEHVEAELVRRGYVNASLHARATAVEFYTRLGYEGVGEEFLRGGDSASENGKAAEIVFQPFAARLKLLRCAFCRAMLFESLRQMRLPMVGLAGSAIAGVVMADWHPLPIWWGTGATLLLGLLTLRWSRGIWLFAAAFFFTLHGQRMIDAPGAAMAGRLEEKPRGAVISGMVDDEPQAGNDEGWRFPMQVRELQLDGRHYAWAAPVLVYWKGDRPRYGDVVEIRGYVAKIRRARNPGEFDYAGYLKRQGIYAEVTMRGPEGGETLAHGQGSGFYAMALGVREWMQNALRLGLGDARDISGLIQSMTLGLQDDTPPDMALLFRETGTMHLFAVSGMNVAMLAIMLWLVLKPFGLRRSRAVWVMVPLVFFYAVLTGLSASGVRSALMVSAVMIAYSSERKSQPINQLAAAAVLILLWDSNQLFLAGFQLSFGVVLALMILVTPLQNRWKRLVAPDPFIPRKLLSLGRRFTHWVAEGVVSFLAVTCASWLGSSPFGWWYFHMVSPVGVAANLVAVPLAFFVMALGALAIATALFSNGLAIIFNNANWLLAKLILWSVSFCAHLPGGHFYVAMPQGPAPALDLTVFDFETGAASLFCRPGASWLVDAGRDRDFQWTLRGNLQTRGINTLDSLWLTRSGTGSIGGAPVAIAEFSPRQIYDPPVRERGIAWKALQQALAAAQRTDTHLARGDEIRVDNETVIRVLYPPRDLVRNYADDRALVLQIVRPHLRILMMSGSGFLTETWLLQQPDDLRSDILIKGLNAHDISGTEDFIMRVRPRLVIAGWDGYRNDHGIPPDWAQMLALKGIALFRQDETGAVTIREAGTGWSAQAFLTDQSFSASRSP
ncbi:MAG: ComEC/Rec2 family competence protein [Chthoniobacteraceae bacterium]